MDIQYVEEQPEEPMTIDYMADEQVNPKRRRIEPTVKIDAQPFANPIRATYKPIERKPPRTKPIHIKVPINQAVFACLEDYLAAVKS